MSETLLTPEQIRNLVSGYLFGVTAVLGGTAQALRNAGFVAISNDPAMGSWQDRHYLTDAGRELAERVIDQQLFWARKNGLCKDGWREAL